ncbi:acyl-CoA/acyl-ACP dehydrogenase [Pseudomonas citronellolis]|jgi:alkylation response protein AidB-like acyl-CoA dehydrogenase|uniref:Acyl-CoA/acyl-ACP dehydrogenase n=1 Tax=Pseudomonas citronellolis TaxID=53408 RepID=A0AAW6P8B8_9PSED|nr:acyl-CoA dehydrogenase family protein [Pseudomonas citronellolis]MDF3843004.1 acyl-CoA/acyl-ACP dehydrogenase [Pseudomonas citronellolis]
MNFDFSDDQRMLRDHAQRFLGESTDCHALRGMLDAGREFDDQLWSQIVEQGWLGVAIDEELGGLGLGTLELCVLMEELGRALAPVPFFSTVCLAAELIKHSRSPQGLEHLRGLAAGEFIACAGLMTPDREWNQVNLRVEADRLFGSSTALAYAGQSDFAVLPALERGEPQILLVDLNQAGVRRETLSGIDPLTPHARLQLEGVEVLRLCAGEDAVRTMAQVVNQAAVLNAFEQIGGAARACELARDYALERYTFGRPIGSYQAVKHKLADMAVKIELARSNAYFGAWAMHAGSAAELGLAAASSLLCASDAYQFCAEECLHLHGGIGYTWEADCHFLYNKARLLAVSVGNGAAWVDRLLTDESLNALHS